jgi:tetraacyldisaccharide 4'-kinase
VNPLAALYGGIVRARNDMYERGTLQVRRLRGPVVSVGNLNVGGSGKTPFVIALGELLQQRGIAFDVISRGYRRATRGVALVDPEGSPREFGDEPLLIARKLRVPVIVGEERYAAGVFAEQKFGPRLHLLDDGFQHRQLARDFDIVLVNASDVSDRLLPAGRLREPLSSLLRADAIVLTNGAPVQGLPLRDQQVWRVSRRIAVPDIQDPCFAFCGVARPESFFAELKAQAIPVAGTLAFPDHHRYTQADVRRLLSQRKQHGAGAFLTTQKDAINLGAAMSDLAPIHAVPVQMQIEDAGRMFDTMVAVMKARMSASA